MTAPTSNPARGKQGGFRAWIAALILAPPIMPGAWWSRRIQECRFGAHRRRTLRQERQQLRRLRARAYALESIEPGQTQPTYACPDCGLRVPLADDGLLAYHAWYRGSLDQSTAFDASPRYVGGCENRGRP